MMIKRMTAVLLSMLLLLSLAAPAAFAEGEALPMPQEKRDMPRGGVWRSETRTPIEEDAAADAGDIALSAEYDEDAFFAYLENACMEHMEAIPVREFQIPADDIGAIYMRFAMTHPMALLRTGYNIEYGLSSGLTVRLYPTYLLGSKEEDDAARILLRQKAAAYGNAAKQHKDPLEQILSVHDAITKDTTYDYNFQDTSYHALALQTEETPCARDMRRCSIWSRTALALRPTLSPIRPGIRTIFPIPITPITICGIV